MPTSARLNEQASFSKIDFETSRTQTLFSPWNGASVAIFGLLTGQWTPDILPPTEQFYLGGARFTRGYYSGQVQGDKALAATGELQLNTNIEMNLFGKSLNIPAQWYVFYDWGETWQNQAIDFATMINSAGGGLRCPVTQNVEVDLEALARFNRFPTGTGNGVSALSEGAFYWRVLSRF
jgi:hemolysin activation/secretion protein